MPIWLELQIDHIANLEMSLRTILISVFLRPQLGTLKMLLNERNIT